MSKKIKQGQTKWKVVVYEPGKIEGYDDQYVACVYRCYADKVQNGNIDYTCGTKEYYICSEKFWNNKLEDTFRKALKKAQLEIAALTT